MKIDEAIFKDFLEKHPYKIIHISGMWLVPDIKNNVDVFFKFFCVDLTDRDYYRVRKIPPYLLRKFSLGTILEVVKVDNKKLKLNITETGELVSVSLNIPYPDKRLFSKLGDVIQDEEYPLNFLIGKYDPSAEIKGQYCIVLESSDCKFIFPVYVIGASFFFISQKFTENLFRLNLREEYHKVDPTSRSIHIKGGFNDINAPFLYLYETNPVAKMVYDSVGKAFLSNMNLYRNINRSNKKNYGSKDFEFKAYFPFYGDNINFVLNGIWINKNKFLVYSIKEFDFGKILGIDKLTILRTERNENIEKKVSFFSKKDSKSTNKISEEVKADKDDFFELLEVESEKIENENLIIEKKSIYFPHKKSDNVRRIPIKEEDNSSKDLTFMKFNPFLDAKGKGLNTQTLEERDITNSFSLNDFLRYFAYVCKNLNIDFNSIDRKYKDISRKYISDPKIPLKNRKFLVLKFSFNQKEITIIEIDHRDLIDSKLYTLIFSGHRYVSDKEIFKTVSSYLDKTKSLKDIETYYEKRGLLFYKKRHPREYKKEFIDDWIETFTDVLKYKV